MNADGAHASHEGDGPGDINMNIRGSTIMTMGEAADGIASQHYGDNHILLHLESGNKITTKGVSADGISVFHSGTGVTDVDLLGSTIMTEGNNADGIAAFHTGTGVTHVDLLGSTHHDGRLYAHGIYAYHTGTGTRDLNITLLPHLERRDGSTLETHSTLTTRGSGAQGIYAIHAGTGEIDILTLSASIKTGVASSSGLYQHGIQARHFGVGDIEIDVYEGSITTDGVLAHGIHAVHEDVSRSDGDVRIGAHYVDITTEGTERYQNLYTYSQGIYGRHRGTGGVDITARGGSVTTKGSFSRGIHGDHQGAGDITIETRDGHTVTTTGDNGDGILAEYLDATDPGSRCDYGGRPRLRQRRGREWGPGWQCRRPRHGHAHGCHGRGRLPPADGHNQRSGDGRDGREYGGRLPRRRRGGLSSGRRELSALRPASLSSPRATRPGPTR